MTRKFYLLLVTLVIGTLSASAYFSLDFDFKGKVGSYPIEGSIELGTTSEIWGRYGYSKNGNKPKAYLDLEGEWESISSTKYRLIMTESDGGVDTGSWNVVYDSKTGKLTGTMITGGKTYTVNASSKTESINSNGRITKKRRKK